MPWECNSPQCLNPQWRIIVRSHPVFGHFCARRPDLGVEEPAPLWNHVELDALLGARQHEVANEENYENDVGERGRHVHHLQRDTHTDIAQADTCMRNLKKGDHAERSVSA